jgi:hypothetical protein
MRFSSIKSSVAALCVLALVACGGGGDGGDPVLGGGGDAVSTAASVEMSTSSTTLGDGESTITVTAIVKDAKNVGMPNTAVTWATSTGNLTGTTATTDSDGKAQAVFAATDRSPGTATISASSGKANGSVQVQLQSVRTVVITPNKTVVGTDGDSVTLSAIVKDAGNVAIAGAAVSWSASVGNLSGQTSVTNNQGVATATFSPGSTFTVASTTITVTSGAASASVPLTIRATATSIELLSTSPSIGTGGDQVSVSAFVKDASNIARVGVPVAWSVDKGRLSSVTTITDSNGLARATLDAGSDKTNRTALITATAGAAVQTLSLPINGTSLSHSGSTSTASGTNLTLTLKVADSKQVPIAGIALTMASTLGNGLPATATTDAAGQASVQYTATRSGADSITVAGAGTSLVIPIIVTGSDEDLTFVAPAASVQVAVNRPQTLTVRYRKAGVAQANVPINLAATIGVLSAASVTTDANGEAMVSVQSSFAGASMLSATLANSVTPVQATLPLRFIATVPATLVLQVTPTALAPNPIGQTAQFADLVAKVTDANGNPVSGSTINFSQVSDPSGGLLPEASARTDTNGVATVRYLSGATTTANNAVQLRAAVASNIAVAGNATMTVNQSALFIALGTGNTITNFNPETYEKTWTVYVTDATGVRVPGVPVTVKVIPNYFAKGRLIWSEVDSTWIYLSYRECLNEDRVNQNGILDAGEDTNNDGTLTPGNVVALTASTVTTDSNGAASIVMRYAELYASWIGVRLTATAIVSGTEATSFKDFPLDKLAGDYSVKTVAPAGVLSPFGTDATSCTNAR